VNTTEEQQDISEERGGQTAERATSIYRQAVNNARVSEREEQPTNDTTYEQT